MLQRTAIAHSLEKKKEIHIDGFGGRLRVIIRYVEGLIKCCCDFYQTPNLLNLAAAAHQMYITGSVVGL